jgi:uncharacterized protein YbbC (DUF1343 family)
LFEGTNYSIGRGTNKPFEFVGKPGISKGDYYFTPRSIKGVADNPLQEGKNCRGFLLTDFANHFVKKSGKIYLSILIDLYKTDTAKATFFNNFFDNLAGTDELRKSIEQNQSEQEIRNRWKPGLEAYRKVRKKYLLYPDFSFIIYDKN